MKRFLLTCWITVCAIGHSAAQTCTPLPDLPDTVVVFPEPYRPDEPGTGIPDSACVGVPFMTVFNINVPGTIETPLGTLPVTSIEFATSGAVRNIPASFTYACYPPDCVFPGNTIGCAVLSGIPQPGEEGQYDLKIDVIVHTTFDIPLTIPDVLGPGNYFLYVNPANAPNCAPSTIRPEVWSRVKALYRD